MADCQVALLVAALDREELPIGVQTGPATAATAYRHEASLTIPHDGRYRFTITARDPAGNGGQQQFDAVVRPVSLSLNTLIFGQIVLAPFVGVWLLREGVIVWRRRLKGPAQKRMR